MPRGFLGGAFWERCTLDPISSGELACVGLGGIEAGNGWPRLADGLGECEESHVTLLPFQHCGDYLGKPGAVLLEP